MSCDQCTDGKRFVMRPQGTPTSIPCPNGCTDTWPRPEVWVCTTPAHAELESENTRLREELAALKVVPHDGTSSGEGK